MNAQELMTRLLFEKFGKLALSDNETAEILEVSAKTLEKDREAMDSAKSSSILGFK